MFSEITAGLKCSPRGEGLGTVAPNIYFPTHPLSQLALISID